MALEDNYIYRVLDRISKIQNNSILWEYSDTDPLEIGNEVGIRWVRNYLNETYWFIDADGNAIQLDINDWGIHGNIGMDSETNYIGNYDNVDLPFRTNNEERVRITADGNVLIGTDVNSTSAILNLYSLSKGFLPPRMTTSQKLEISNPEDGLMVFDTDLQVLSLYYNMTWNAIGGGGGVLSFNGRTGDVTLLDEDVISALGYIPENVANKVTTIVPELINDTEYPSTSAVYNYIAGVIANLPQKYRGAFQHDASQYATADNVGHGVIFGTNDISGHGVEIIGDSLGNKTLIRIENDGTYNIQFSFQFINADTQIKDVTIWLRKNGEDTSADIAGTGGFVSIPNSHGGTVGHNIVAWNYFVEAVAGDNFQLVWSTTDHNHVSMEFLAAGNPPPSCASAILTVNQVN